MKREDLPDYVARERISKDLATSFFVEAGAGSGKTFSLVDRVVNLIRYGRAIVENISVVTFTRKAAAELRERIQIDLEKLFRGSNASEEEKQRIDAALQTVERSSISTIHAFCASILRERPVEAGVDPGFEEMEEDDDAVFAERVWAEYVEKKGLGDSTVIGEMQSNGVSPVLLKDIYKKLVDSPDVEAVQETVPRPDFKEAKEKVRGFIIEMRKRMPREEPPNGWDDLQKSIRKCLKLFDIGYLEEDRLFVQLLKSLDKKNIKVTLKCWPAEDGKDRSQEMVVFRDGVVRPALRLWREYLHKSLIEFVIEGARYYAEWRRERSILNFQDLLMITANMLRGNAEVRSYFKKKIRYLLVDEFQDTDPIQAEIVMLLTGESDTENDWHKIQPRKGALFLVGDPKQSIYRFRRADIDIFNRVKRMFREGAGEVLELTSNFRSLDPVRDITDSVFVTRFPQEATKYQAQFAPLITTRGKNEGFDTGVFENPIEKVAGNRADIAAMIDAQIIAAWIHAALKGDLRLERADDEKTAGKSDRAEPGDFMIISRVRARLHRYAQALESLGIPYEIAGGKNFSNSEELYELYKVLKAIADPSDSVALVAALRGLFFGVSDNDLYLFAKGGGRFSYFRKEDNGPDAITKAYAQLREFHEIVESHTPLTAIEMIVEKLGILPLALSREIGASRGGNILKAVELLRDRRAEGSGSFAELVDYLQEIREVNRVAEMTLFPGTSKAVRIMNLHKAKGLEAPVVILADPLGIERDKDPVLHIKRVEDTSRGYFAVTLPKNDYAPDLVATPREWEKHVIEEKMYESAETIRKDYVAVTRAKNILVVSTYSEGNRKKAWESLFPYLSGMPKLKVGAQMRPQTRKSVSIDANTWAKEMNRIESNLRAVREESYHRASVTEMVKSPDIFWGGGEDGTSWGRIVHKALEACARGKRSRLELFAQNWITEENRPPKDLPRLISLVDGIVKSEMWQRMLKSQEKYFEVPFSVRQADTIIRGAIDLIFKEKDGWVIVDYKTDKFEKMPERKKAYQDQISMYADLWEKMTKEKVKEKMLCLV